MASRPLPHGRDGWFSLMRNSYAKPFKTVTEQIELLRSNGMTVVDEDSATRYLQSVGYYRLSGYWYPDRERVPVPTTDPKMLPEFTALSQFRPGTTFEDAHRRYEFDRRLKLLVLDGLERVEVAMRFQLGHVLGEGHPYAHYDQDALSSSFTGVAGHGGPLDRVAWLSSEHSKWVLKVRRQEDDSKEEFVKHFRRKYGAGLPVWVITEILDFGGMSTLFAGLKQTHRDQIAESMGFEADNRGDGASLATWMKNLNYIRNTCAHHARLWNKNMAVQGSDLSKLPDLAHADEAKDRLYASVAVISFLLLRIDSDATWRKDFASFVNAHASVANPQKMGFPSNWDREKLWDPQYKPHVSPEVARRRRIRNKFECLTSSEVGLRIAPMVSRKEATSVVRGLRYDHSLLGLQLEASTPVSFPIFQIDESNHGIKPLVAYANQAMKAKAEPWRVAEWWISAHPSLGGRTPLRHLEDGLLTEADVDFMLKR